MSILVLVMDHQFTIMTKTKFKNSLNNENIWAVSLPCHALCAVHEVILKPTPTVSAAALKECRG